MEPESAIPDIAETKLASMMSESLDLAFLWLIRVFIKNLSSADIRQRRHMIGSQLQTLENHQRSVFRYDVASQLAD